MTREQADDAFEALSRHARAIPVPTEAAAALKLVDGASLAQLQRDAIVHYISVGPAVVNLAYRVLKAGTATFVAAGFAAGQAGGVTPREVFAERMIALDERLAEAAPKVRASELIDTLAARLIGGRELLGGAADAAGGIGDLLEAAGIAYLLAALLENPPRAAPVAG